MIWLIIYFGLIYQGLFKLPGSGCPSLTMTEKFFIDYIFLCPFYSPFRIPIMQIFATLMMADMY
jgi:hypothetical protein